MDEFLLAVLAERQRRKVEAAGGVDFKRLLFPEQAAAFDDPSRWLALPGGRQGGKTDLAEKLLLRSAMAREGTQSFYVSTSIKRARNTVWDELVEFNRTLQLGGKPNHGLLTIAFPRQRTKLTVTGVEHRKMADDLRGRKKVALYVVDECQDWPDDLLRYFYEKVIYPSLSAVAGGVVFAGTGGPPRGFWHDVATKDPTYGRHLFTPLTNPFLAAGEAQALIAKACKDRGVDISDPSIQREFFARFVADLTRQIFPWDARKNAYRRDELPGGTWQHVVTADFGTVDATSVGCLGWSDADPRLWLVDRVAKKGLGASGQTKLFNSMMAKYERTLVGAVGDPGGGGAALIVDLQGGPGGIDAEAAKKAAKASACLLMRDGLRTGMGPMIPEDDAEMIEDLQKPEWDPDNVGKAVRGHFPDNVDMLLYGFRKARSLNWFEEPPLPAKPLTPIEVLEQRLADQDDVEHPAEQDWAERDWGGN